MLGGGKRYEMRVGERRRGEGRGREGGRERKGGRGREGDVIESFSKGRQR